MSERSRTYHHGDLADALVQAALTTVREVGPTALSLREVTRTAGVSPAAAYRHFQNRSDLMAAVAHQIQLRMADQMRRRMRAPQADPPDQRALQRLRGVGLGYISFAMEEPGWFMTAFFGDETTPVDPEPETKQLAPPFALLISALDGLVQAGLLAHERRPGAEYSCWSAVHGCAELTIRGPLRHADGGTQREIAARVVEDAITGILH